MYAANFRGAFRTLVTLFALFFSLFTSAQNNALDFDGTNDYVTIGDVAALDGASQLTFEAWIKPQTAATGERIFSKETTTSTDGTGMALFGASGDQLFLSTRNGVNATGNTGSVLTIGSWNHVAYVFNGSGTGNSERLRCYVNGIEQSLTYNGTVPSTLTSNAQSLTLGIRSPLDFVFDGEMDEVRFWSDARTELEIRTNMTKSLTGSESNLIAYYNFDEGTAASDNSGVSAPEIQDQTSNNFDGTLSGFAKTGSTSNWVDASGNDVGATFITTWQTTTASEAVQLPTGSGTYNYSINWGDGTVESLTAGSPSHTYTTAGTYAISVDGTFPHFRMANNSTHRTKILTIEQWGDIAWTSMEDAFNGCSNLTYNALDAPNLSSVTNTSDMFRFATSFDGNLSSWNVSNVTNMSSMFGGAAAYNNGSATLTWGSNTSSVTDMSFMFSASGFNQDLSGWNVSSVQNMQAMFSNADAFNNGGVALTWGSNTSSVQNMNSMFTNTDIFNQDISSWNVSSVTDMTQMFSFAPAFNNGGQTLNWGANTSTVNSMSQMFASATSFNQDISGWDVSGVTNMSLMLFGASSFNQDLSAWDISSATSMNLLLGNTAMSVTNYDNTIIGWATLGAGETQIPSNITFTATGLSYCESRSARSTLETTYNWSFSGDALQAGCIEINVQGNNNDIADGSTTISSTIDTDFGLTYLTGTAISYTIQNTGTSTLNISSITSTGTNSSEFVVSGAPSTVSASGSETFTVTFTPTGSGTRTATITVNSDDADEAAYDFAVQGSGSAPGGISTDLQLWLKAGEGFTVSQWDDQSGNSNNATQGTASAQPSSTANAINFNAAVDFDGSDFLALANSASTMGLNNSDYELLFVANSSSTATQFLISGVTQERYEMHINGAAGFRFIPANATNFSDIGSNSDYDDGISRIFGGTLQSTGASAASHVNGLFTTDIETAGLQTSETGSLNIGRRGAGAGSLYWNGQIGEAIIFGDALTSTQRQQVFSYLALKYGITLDQTSATDYLAADGATVWNATTNATYNNDVAGLARDDASELDQRQSGSINSGAIIEIANGTHASPSTYSADDSWLIWGHDNGATTFGTNNINNSNATTSNRMTRVWRVQETGTVGSVEIRFSNSLATGTVSLVAHTSNASFPADGNRRVVEMTDDGAHYSASIDLSNGEYFTFANANYATLTSQFVVINEVITDPQQDWGASNFFNPSPGGTGDADDEWIELFISTDDLNLSSWTIEMNDGTNVSGNLSAGGAFNQSNYRSLTGGSLTKTKSGDYLILGDPSSGMMNSTGGLTVILKDGNGGTIDQVTIATGSGTGFTGSASSTIDESVARIPNGSDTDVDATDFVKTRATLGGTSSPTGTVVINEVVTDPFTDWSTSSFDGTLGAGTVDDNDEWIELYIGTAGLNLTGWTIEMNDGTNVSGSIASGGVFGTVNYVSTNSGSFINTQAGDYLILGNPSGEINNTSLTIILRDASNAIVDQVTIGGGSGEAPSGSNSAFNSEAIVRYPNATDTGTDDSDFVQTRPTLGNTNSPTGTVVINEVVTDPKQDWSTNGFDGTIAGGTISEVDEWIELYIGTAGINLTNWTLELTDGSNVTGNLTSSGAFDVSNYISSGSGNFSNTTVGDFLVLGNPDGSGSMEDDIVITLKDASGTTIDQIELGDDVAGDGNGDGAPDGSSNGGLATGISNEAIARIPNGTDSGNDVNDFAAVPASLGALNSTAQLPGVGNGLVFDGVDDFVELGTITNLNDADFSIEFWVNTTVNTASILTLSDGDATYEAGEKHVYIHPDGWVGFTAFGNGFITSTGLGFIDDGNWHHVAVAWDYLSGTSGTGKIYVDGVDVTTGSTVATNNADFGTIKLGQKSNHAGTATNDFAGTLDEVRFWNDVRTHEEIIENMMGLLDPSETNLQAYYRFDQSSGTTLNDLRTSSPINGTLTNMAGTEWTAAGWSIFAQNQAIFQSGGSDISTGTSGELTLTDVSFLNDDNDLLLAGHDNGEFSEVATDLPSGTLITTRYNRTWNLTKNDASGTSNGSVKLGFDLGATPNVTYTYYLLERTGTSGDFAIVPALGVNPNGNSIEFTVDASAIDNGSYYTLGRSDAGVGNALNFDGTNDYVDLGSQILNSSAFTIEAWVNGSSFANTGRFNRIMALNYGSYTSDNPFTLFVDNSGNIGYVFGTGATATDQQAPLSFSPTLSSSTWYHVVLTFDGAQKQLYVDGVLYGTISDAGTFTNTNSESLIIGDFDTGSSDNGEWEGSIDEVRIWSDVRTQQEILDNMFANLTGDEANLAAYYRFNQGIGDSNTNLPDLSPNSNSGTLTNFNNLGSATTSSNYIASTRTTIAASATIINGGNLTATDGELTLSSTQNAGDFLQDANDFIRWNNDGGSFTETTADIPTGTLVTNRYTKTWQLDKNDAVGTANGNVTFTFDLGAIPDPDYTYFLLSRSGTSGNFAIVEALGSSPSGNNISFVADAGQVTDSHYFTLGRTDAGAGNSLDFDGTNDYVTLGDVDAIDGLTTFTFEAWIRPVTVATGERIFSKEVGSGSDGISMGVFGASGDQLQLAARNGSNSFGFTDSVLSIGSWNHVAYVYNGAGSGNDGKLKCFVNGIERPMTYSNTIPSSFSSNAQSFVMGLRSSALDLPFDGEMDEVRVWSDVRTEQEIKDNLNRKLNVANESNLLAYYQFNTGIASGTNTGVNVATDRSGTGNSGTLTNFALSSTASNWLTSAAVVADQNIANSLQGAGNALNFDGVSEFVAVADNASLETSSTLTVEAWVRPDVTTSFRGIAARYFSGGDASNVFALQINSGNYQFLINESDNNLISASATATASIWTHVAGVADGNNVNIYVDGILIASTSYDGTITSNSARELFLGKYRTEDQFGTYDGLIDEVRIWNTARTASEIQANMFESLSGSESGLVAYYTFNESTGTTLDDNSTNSNTGTLNNMDETNWVNASAREPFKTNGPGNLNSGGTWVGGAAPGAAQTLYIQHDLTVDADLTVDDFNLTSGNTLTLGSGQTLTVTGNLVNNGTITGDGKIQFTSGNPMISGGSFSNLEMNGGSPILCGNTTMTGTLTLTSGNLQLQGFNLTLNSGASISGGSSSSYIQTINQNSSGGSVSMEIGATSGVVTYPIGTNTNYTPIFFTNLGTTATFAIRTFDGIYPFNTAGVAFTQNVISKTWDVNATGTGFNVTLSIQWNSADELTGFDRTNMYVSTNDGSGWTERAGPLSATEISSGIYQATASGITSFSGVGGGGDVVTPVTLLDFYAQQIEDGIELIWHTATEINNEKFIIERSSNGIDFEAIDEIPGNGDSEDIIEYRFVDSEPMKGTNYYRLKQMDFDGEFEYSPIVLAEAQVEEREWVVYPNPFSDRLYIGLKEANEPASIKLTSMNGQVILSETVVSDNRFVQFKNLQAPTGLYILEIQQGDQMIRMRIVNE